MLTVFQVDSFVPLKDRDLFWFLIDRINKAKSRVWASVFIVDMRVEADPMMEVREIIRSLELALWRGVDVRLLVGSSQRTASIHIANATTHRYLSARGFPVRMFASSGDYGLHSKNVVIDEDWVICGSHNWTTGAFRMHVEDSIALKSRDINQRLAEELDKQWNSSVT